MSSIVVHISIYSVYIYLLSVSRTNEIRYEITGYFILVDNQTDRKLRPSLDLLRRLAEKASFTKIKSAAMKKVHENNFNMIEITLVNSVSRSYY